MLVPAPTISFRLFKTWCFPLPCFQAEIAILPSGMGRKELEMAVADLLLPEQREMIKARPLISSTQNTRDFTAHLTCPNFTCALETDKQEEG